MEISDLKNKSINGVAWNFIGKIATHLVTFIVSVFLARLLSLSDFGLVAMAMIFISISQVFMDFGLTSALIQKKEPSQLQINTTFWLNLIIAIALTMLVFAFSGLISNFYENPEVGKIVRVVSLMFVIYAANGVQRAMLTKQLKIKQLTYSNLSGAIVQGIVGIWLAFSGFAAWSLVWGNIAGALTSSVILWLQADWKPKFMFRLREIGDLFNFGYKMFFVSLLESIYVKLDELIIGKIFNSDTLGSYNRAKSFNNIIVTYTSQSLQGVFFPVISHLQDDFQAIKRVVVKSLEAISFLVFGITGLLYLDAEPLIVLLFGKKWLVSVGYFKILAFVSYAFPVSAILVNVLLGLGKSGAFLKLDIWKKIIGLAGMAIGFVWGIYGYLWALMVINFIGVSINMQFIGKYINLKMFAQWKIILKYAVLGFLTALPVWLLNKYLPNNLWLLLSVNTLIFSGLYILVNLFLKTNGFVYVKNIFLEKIVVTLQKRFKK